MREKSQCISITVLIRQFFVAAIVVAVVFDRIWRRNFESEIHFEARPLVSHFDRRTNRKDA